MNLRALYVSKLVNILLSARAISWVILFAARKHRVDKHDPG
jgi:hypothetical protein